MSIGNRLNRLVLCELLIALSMVIVAAVALGRLSDQAHHMHGYVFAPLGDIGDALAATNDLADAAGRPDDTERARASVARLRGFIDRYQRQWEVADSTLPEAVRFREMLARDRQLALTAEEHDAVQAFVSALPPLEGAAGRGAAPAGARDLRGVRAALVRLDRVNVRFMAIAYDAYMRTLGAIALTFIVVGLGGVVAAPLFGVAVRRAIAPRVAQLVRKVERFRELGVHEPIGDQGGDELAVLAHALDVGFGAIAARDKERERFLAVAAHELKTPLTTLKGFAHVAITHSEEPPLRDRALAVIDRQAMRLARLVDDLLGAAAAEVGLARYLAKPFEIGDLQAAVGGAA